MIFQYNIWLKIAIAYWLLVFFCYSLIIVSLIKLYKVLLSPNYNNSYFINILRCTKAKATSSMDKRRFREDGEREAEDEGEGRAAVAGSGRATEAREGRAGGC